MQMVPAATDRFQPQKNVRHINWRTCRHRLNAFVIMTSIKDCIAGKSATFIYFIFCD